jgi:type IV pilus assembly protein PilN
MAKVNLLPWRAERRKHRQREFYILLGSAAIGALVLGILISVYYSGQISGQNQRNAYLADQITKLDAQIKEIEQLDLKKDRLLRRKEVIEQLQANRAQMVHLFDELVRTIPEGVRLTSLKQNGEQLTLEGQSQSNARVSAYMRNLESSGWMTNPDLSIIEAAGEDKTLPYKFNLVVMLTKPGQPKDANGVPIPQVPGAPAAAPAPAPTPAPAAPASAGNKGAKP